MVDWRVALVFMPGAVLVPMTDVRIEVQGYIEAGIQQIFDVFVDPESTDLSGRPARAGKVIFSSQNIRQAYPEWWGARPAGANPDALSADEIRRTTRALQATIDAAYTDMAFMSELGHSPSPPIPIVLNNDYVIDDELSIGLPTIEVFRPRESDTPRTAGFVLRGNRGPSDSIRGNVRIIASRTSARFMNEPGGSSSKFPAVPPDTMMGGLDGYVRLPYGIASLLTIRGPAGFTIENVTFDANATASRCVTVADGAGGQHNAGFEGCAFVRARSELVHCGAELQRDPTLPETVYAGLHTDNRNFWNGNQDLTGLRFVQCRFETVAHAMGAQQSATGVYFFAGQTLGAQFRGCEFAGPGNPMIHVVNGRLSLDRCHFKTTALGNPVQRARIDPMRTSTNGVDLFLDLPLPITTESEHAPKAGYNVACFTARDVVSESPQFLTTFSAGFELSGMRTLPVTTVTQAAAVLRSVQHFPPPGNDRPTIWWDGVGSQSCPLVLMGCDFPAWSTERRSPVHVTQHVSGVVYDLGNQVRGRIDLFELDRGVSRMANVMTR